MFYWCVICLIQAVPSKENVLTLTITKYLSRYIRLQLEILKKKLRIFTWKFFPDLIPCFDNIKHLLLPVMLSNSKYLRLGAGHVTFYVHMPLVIKFCRPTGRATRGHISRKWRISFAVSAYKSLISYVNVRLLSFSSRCTCFCYVLLCDNIFYLFDQCQKTGSATLVNFQLPKYFFLGSPDEILTG